MAELTDGRLLIVEHKGKVYATNDDSKEKSGGKALFLMTMEDKSNPSLFNQIAAKIA